MDKSREARKPAMAATNGLLRRRSRSSAVREIKDDGHAARQSSLIDRVEKRDRDRDSLNRTKRRRSDRISQKNEREEEGEESSDDSFSADEETPPHGTASFQGIHRKSLPLPCVSRKLKVAEEMIGVPVPRKARSACVKRSHECRTSSASQSFEAGSPSSSNVSVKQKLMSNGSKNRQSKQSLKSSVSVQNDLEIEIAEVLSGLRQSQSSKKEDETDNFVNLIELKDGITANYDANSSPTDSRKTRVNREDSSVLMRNSSNTSVVNAETQRPSQMESSTSKTRETIKSNVEMKQETPKLSMKEGSENKETSDSKDSSLIKGKSGGPEVKCQRQDNNDKFKIDLMAPPFISTSSSPGRDAFVPSASDFKPTAQNSDLKENLFKVTTEASREKKENGEWLKLDLEMPKQNCSLKLLSQGQEQPQEQQLAKPVVPKTEYISPPNSVPLCNAVGNWANDQKSFGYMTPPFQTIKPVTGSNGSSPALQSTQFIAYQPRSKRCATHHYIARNIQLHQQMEKTSAGSATGCSRQSNLYAKPPPAERLLTGNASPHCSFPVLSLSSSQAEGQVSANIPPLKIKASDNGINYMNATQMKQVINQQAPQRPPILQLPGQDFIVPVTHHHQPVAATTIQSTPPKAIASTKISSLADKSTSVRFNFQSSAASEAPSYMTVLPNNGYHPFTVASQAAVKNGSPAPAVPFFNGSFYSSHVSVPSQYQQQQQAHRDTRTSNGLSSSHKQPHTQANTMQKQQLPSTHQSLKPGTNTREEKSSAVSDSWVAHSQKGGYSQTSTIPVQPFNFSMSFASLNGSGTSSNFNFSTVGQNPTVVQANGYHMVAGTPQSVQQKNHVVIESKNIDQKKIAMGKTPIIPSGQTLVFDNSARTLNFMSTPITGGWPHRAVTATAVPSVSSVYSSVPISHQIQIQKHPFLQQQSQQSGRSNSPSTATTLPSLTVGGSFNHKQFQQIQRNRTQQGETQISFAGNPKPVVVQSQAQQQMLHSSQPQQYMIAGSPPNTTANSTGGNKTGSSAQKTQSQQTDSSSTAQKSSPVCGRNVPSIISSSPSQLSELK